MVDAEQGPQEYQLFAHEVKALGIKEKKVLAFKFAAHKSKPLTTLKDSTIATDLLYILTLSKKAVALMEENTYEFTLTRDFKLQISLVKTL